MKDDSVMLTSKAGSLLGNMISQRHLISIKPGFLPLKFDLKCEKNELADLMRQQQESIPVGCVPPTCQLYVFWWRLLGVSTMGISQVPWHIHPHPLDFPPTPWTYPTSWTYLLPCY